MALIVLKYGGTSVADPERLRQVAQSIATRHRQGHQVAVVVSAMGNSTDELLKLAHRISERPASRELDTLLATGELVSASLLAMALEELGEKAVSLSGAQAGISTDSSHGQAQILSVNPDRLLKELGEGRIVIVAGFQGVNQEADVTTLGRGGSDTTALALAVELKASRCEIYTDVEGVFTADPRLVPQARRLSEVGYEEMMELAIYGARVVQPRAVELGEVYNVPILVVSSFAETPGTLIHGGFAMEAKNKVRGVAHDLDVAKITVHGVPDRPGIAAAIFEPLAQGGVAVDTIVQNVSVQGVTDLSFTVSRQNLEQALALTEVVSKQVGAQGCLGDKSLGKVSIVGSGMQNAPGYAARMFRALYDAGINIELITTSEIRITCLMEESKIEDAVLALHLAFELDKEEA